MSRSGRRVGAARRWISAKLSQSATPTDKSACDKSHRATRKDSHQMWWRQAPPCSEDT